MGSVMNFKHISSKYQIPFSVVYIIRVLYYEVEILVLASSFNDYTHFHGILIVLLKSVFLQAYLLHNCFYFYNRFAFIHFFKYIQYTDL